MSNIRTKDATVRTAQVEIRTLTVSGKQVTLAVFRQLFDRPILTAEGTLNGTPWGIVNYHPDPRCRADDAFDHWHVVWQLGDDLYRSRVQNRWDCPSCAWVPDEGRPGCRRRECVACDRHDLSVASLSALPQLFIAV